MNGKDKVRLQFRVALGLFLSLIIGTVLLVVTAPAPTRAEVPFSQAVLDKKAYAYTHPIEFGQGRQRFERVFAGGVVMYVDPEREVFLISGYPLPVMPLEETEFFLVRGSVMPATVQVGDMINLVGPWVSSETFTPDGETVETTAYYVSGSNLVEIVGHVDVASNSQFAEVAVLVEQSQSGINPALILPTWHLLTSSSSPFYSISPFRRTYPKP